MFTKLAKLHAKQSFSFAIIIGDLFGDCSTEHELDEISALLHGNISVPLPTYFTLGNRALPTRVIEKIEADDEVCTNLYFLGKRGTLKTAEGVRIAALGGRLNTTNNKATNKFHPAYTESDARSLYGVHSADILISNQWPKGIQAGSKVPIPERSSTPEEAQCLADVCSTLKPRYHLSSADFFWEREPFFHMPTEDESDAKPTTRFISIASYSKASGQKWMYAFTLDPKAPIPMTVPTGTTATPLAAPQAKRKALPNQRDSYRFNHDTDSHSRPRKKPRGPPPGPESCFFCLSNPTIATHLITSIGNEAYLTTARGPLPTSDTFPALGFPCHVLIIPFTHTPTLSSITDAAARDSVYSEMQRYRAALHAMLTQKAESALGAVTWEVARSNGVHVHWQFLPATTDLIDRGLVEAAFKVEAENLKYPSFEKNPASPDHDHDHDHSAENADGVGDYFRVRIWRPSSFNQPTESQDGVKGKGESEGKETTLHLPLPHEIRFDMQFGRRVMAKLMQLDARVNWKDGVQTVGEEEKDAEAFKAAFKEWDFSFAE